MLAICDKFALNCNVMDKSVENYILLSYQRFSPLTQIFPDSFTLVVVLAVRLKLRFWTLLNETCHCGKGKYSRSMLRKVCADGSEHYNIQQRVDNSFTALTTVVGACISCLKLYFDCKEKISYI